MNARWHHRWRLLAVTFDVAALAIALGGAAVLRFGPADALELTRIGVASLSAPWLLGIGIWISAMASFGLYNPTRCANGVEEARRLVAACFTAPTAFVLFSFFMRTTPSRLWIATGTVAALASAGIGRRCLRATVGRLRRRGKLVTRSIVVGDYDAKVLVDTLSLDPTWGSVPVGTCGFQYGDLPSFDLDQVARAVAQTGAEGVVVVGGELGRDEVRRAIDTADDLGVSTLVVPGLDYMLLHNLQLVALGPEPALALEQPHLNTRQRVSKRTADVVGSLAGLILLLPLYALLALAIRLDTKGSAFFIQKRIGLRGKEFNVWKFRTMVVGAHAMRTDYDDLNEAEGALFKISDDPRITRVGKIIRKFSLDELPQLWNVLRGEMSLVGPRPALPEEVDGYETALRRRLNVRPGMTGLWQVSGRSDLAFEDYVRLDLTYVRNWGLLLDLYILLRTIPVVLGAKGAY